MTEASIRRSSLGGFRVSRRTALRVASTGLFGWRAAWAADARVLSTAKIESSAGGLKRTGSGILVGMPDLPDYSILVLTASHVVAGDSAPKIAISSTNPDRVRLGAASVVASEPGDDGLALLKVKVLSDSRNVQLANLRSTLSFAPGLPIEAVGMSIFSGDWAPISGQLVRLEADRLQFSGSVDEGYSGGPVFCTGEPTVGAPEIIGMITQARGQGGVAATADRIYRFLKSHTAAKLDFNHNSMYAKQIQGRWRYYYAGQLNADEKVIQLRANILTVDHAPQIPLPSTFEDVRMRGDTLSFKTRLGGEVSSIRLRVVSPDQMVGYHVDARGSAELRWERVGPRPAIPPEPWVGR